MEKLEFNGTPGNWYIVPYRKDVCEFAIESDVYDFATDGRICSHKFWSEGFRSEAMANAHLIAASKDLLEACIAMVAACNKYNIEHLVPEYEAMTTAISKALNTTSNE